MWCKQNKKINGLKKIYIFSYLWYVYMCGIYVRISYIRTPIESDEAAKGIGEPVGLQALSLKF